jgi:probable F420-dependent oxidoreductase
MRIGLGLPHYDYPTADGPLSWEGLLEATLRAEALGFDSAWISDHFFVDITRYGGPEGSVGTPEAFTAAAALAVRTSRIRLGTLVACAPFRHPGHVAKMATAIDLVSGGRFDLGLGAGWYEAEFDAFGYGFGSSGERFAVLEETVEAVAALLSGGPVTYEGRYVRLRDAFNHPLPATPGGPPLWVGGKGGDRLLRLAARSAAGWNTVWRWTIEDYGLRVERLREIAEREGRDPASVRLSIGLYALVGEDERELARRYASLQRWTPGGAIDGESLDEWSRPTLTGTVDRCAERLEEFAELGVEEMILSAGSLPFAVFDWSMVELIASELVPRAHDLAPAWSSRTPR